MSHEINNDDENFVSESLNSILPIFNDFQTETFINIATNALVQARQEGSMTSDILTSTVNNFIQDFIPTLTSSNIANAHFIITSSYNINNVLDSSLDEYTPNTRNPDIATGIASEKVSENIIGESCCICISKFEIDENITKLGCNHVLHTKCIEEWVKYKQECPTCRQNILPTPSTSQ